MLTLHHLETSRSSRIIWLLEGLGLEYTLVTHKRGPNLRAPLELKRVHPLGKAPTIVDGDLVLAESATILRYIAERHGNGHFMPPPGTDARAIHDERLDYAESSLMMPLMMKLMGQRGAGLPESLDQFSSRELDRALTYVSLALGEGPFLMGDGVTLADMQMSYCLAVLERGGLLQNRPTLKAYWQRIQEQPGFRRSIEIGGPLLPSGR
jgi:glutathione S-transferase